MNNKEIIEFGFRIISRIMEILEGVIGLDLYDFSDDTKPEFNNCLIYILRRSILTRNMIITVLSEDFSKESYFLISVLVLNSFIVFLGGMQYYRGHRIYPFSQVESHKFEMGYIYMF